MLTAIIIDDEAKLRKVLEIKLAQHCPQIKVIGHASNVSEAYEKIIDLNPDLIFLDIAMPGATGFDLIERFETVDFEIIFVTGYHEYALDALKVSAIDYLLKPIDTENLKHAVAKAVDKLKTKSLLAQFELLKHNLNHVGDQNSKIAIPGSESYKFVKVADIIRCEGWQKYSKVFLSNGEVIISSYNLGVFKNMLEGYGFYGTHKSHFVNMEHIVEYHKDGVLKFTDGSEAPVSRRRKEDFLARYIQR